MGHSGHGAGFIGGCKAVTHLVQPRADPGAENDAASDPILYDNKHFILINVMLMTNTIL